MYLTKNKFGPYIKILKIINNYIKFVFKPLIIIISNCHYHICITLCMQSHSIASKNKLLVCLFFQKVFVISYHFEMCLTEHACMVGGH